jgi:hypothetical protein
MPAGAAVCAEMTEEVSTQGKNSEAARFKRGKGSPKTRSACAYEYLTFAGGSERQLAQWSFSQATDSRPSKDSCTKKKALDARSRALTAVNRGLQHAYKGIVDSGRETSDPLPCTPCPFAAACLRLAPLVRLDAAGLAPLNVRTVF